MENIKDILSRVIEKISPQSPHPYERVQEIWGKMVDDKTEKHTKVVGIKNDQVLIYVDSSAWLYQVNLEKEKFLIGLKQEFPQIKSIFFKIGKVRG